MPAIAFRVTGRVQGVGFRAWTCRAAARLGLTGWVRNVEDGTVEGVAEGDERALGALTEALNQGSMHAVVYNVRVHPTTSSGHEGFAARPTAARAEFPAIR
jgi:acylphosphatase